jgi:hypothetical protein
MNSYYKYAAAAVAWTAMATMTGCSISHLWHKASPAAPPPTGVSFVHMPIERMHASLVSICNQSDMHVVDNSPNVIECIKPDEDGVINHYKWTLAIAAGQLSATGRSWAERKDPDGKIERVDMGGGDAEKALQAARESWLKNPASQGH